MPFALQKSRPCMDRWEPWLSSNKITGFSFEHLVCLTKCSKNSRKCDSFIHPDGLADPELPGAHLRKWSRKCTLGKMKKVELHCQLLRQQQLLLQGFLFHLRSFGTVPICPIFIEPTCPNHTISHSEWFKYTQWNFPWSVWGVYNP